jgi:hypothetical protein
LTFAAVFSGLAQKLPKLSQEDRTVVAEKFGQRQGSGDRAKILFKELVGVNRESMR